MAEKITAIYDVEITGMDKVQKSVATTTDLLTDMGNEAKAAFSDAQIDEATASLSKFNDTAEETVTQFSNVKKELRELTKQINSEQLSGKALETAKRRAAELTDQIGDTRAELNRLASDTGVFDDLVEGARAVTAGFSVVQGAFGAVSQSSKLLQQSILKVQSALALLTGTQELATIATNKGGIAQKAYNAAIEIGGKIVDKFKTSTIAAFGAVGFAIAAVSAIVISLIDEFKSAQDEAAEYEKFLQEQSEKRFQESEKTRTDYLARLSKADQEYIKQQEVNAKQAIANGENETQVRARLLQDRIAAFKHAIEVQDNLAMLGAQNEAERTAAAEQESARREAILDAEIEYMKLVQAEEKRFLDARKKAAAEALKAREKDLALLNSIGTIDTKSFDTKDLVKQIVAGMEAGATLDDQIKFLKSLGLNDEAIAEVLKQARQNLENAPEAVAEIKVVPKLPPDFSAQIAQELERTLSALQSSIGTITNNIFSQQVSNLQTAFDESKAIIEEQEQDALARAEGNAQKRTEIEALYAKKRERQDREFAYKKALLERQQAITNRDLALANLAINTAISISKTAAEVGFPAAIPFIALAVAQAGLQAAAIASAPIPDIPKFKTGVIDFKGKGTETSDENLVLISNRESVINARATKKHKAALKAINEDSFSDYVYKTILLPELMKSQRAQSEAAEFNDGRMVKTMREEHQRDREHTRKAHREMASIIAEKNYLNAKHFGK